MRKLLSPYKWMALLPFATGLALVAYILTRLPLWAGICVAATSGALAAWAVWTRTPAARRGHVLERLKAGVLAGALATAAYDVFRLGMVRFLGFTFWPFDIFGVFGRALLGDGADEPLRTIAGVIFHFCNGIGFGIGYMFLIRKPSVSTGIAWAFFLEVCMVSLYPGWLNIQALMSEFLSVSIFGHLIYGLVLGKMAERLPQEANKHLV